MNEAQIVRPVVRGNGIDLVIALLATQPATGKLLIYLYLLKDVCDRKMPHTEFFKSSAYYYSSYTLSKIDEKIIVTDEKTFRVCKAFDHER